MGPKKPAGRIDRISISGKVELDLKLGITPQKGKKLPKSCIKKCVFDIQELSMPAQVLTITGKLVKNECEIHIRDLGFVIVQHSYEYMKNIIQPKEQTSKIGFKFKAER